MTELLYDIYVMCCTTLFLCDLCCVYSRVYRVRTERSTKLGPEGQQSYSLEWLIYVLEWYFGELTKLYAYSVMCYVFQVLVMIAGRRRNDSYTRTLEFKYFDLGVLY